jgi:hypothetical protein
MNRYVTFGLALFVVASAVSGCIRKSKSSVDSFEYTSELRKGIVTEVHDEGRAEQMLLVVNEIEKNIFRLDAQTRDVGKEYARLNGDYNASREDFDALFARYQEDLEKLTNALWEARGRLKELATKEEWVNIADKEMSIFESWNPGVN